MEFQSSDEDDSMYRQSRRKVGRHEEDFVLVQPSPVHDTHQDLDVRLSRAESLYEMLFEDGPHHTRRHELRFWELFTNFPYPGDPDYAKFVNSRPALQFARECALLDHRLQRYYRTSDGETFLSTRCKYEGTFPFDVDHSVDLMTNAQQITKARWLRDGIWNPNWDKRKKFDIWAHEEIDQISGMDPNASRPARQFELSVAAELFYLNSAGIDADQFDPKYIFDIDAARKDLECLLIENILHELDEERPSGLPPPPDWPPIAFANVKRRWVLHHIWDPSWEHTPGQNWQHERYNPKMMEPWDKLYSYLPKSPEEKKIRPEDRSDYGDDNGNDNVDDNVDCDQRQCSCRCFEDSNLE